MRSEEEADIYRESAREREIEGERARGQERLRPDRERRRKGENF